MCMVGYLFYQVELIWGLNTLRRRDWLQSSVHNKYNLLCQIILHWNDKTFESHVVKYVMKASTKNIQNNPSTLIINLRKWILQFKTYYFHEINLFWHFMKPFYPIVDLFRQICTQFKLGSYKIRSRSVALIFTQWCRKSRKKV